MIYHYILSKTTLKSINMLLPSNLYKLKLLFRYKKNINKKIVELKERRALPFEFLYKTFLKS